MKIRTICAITILAIVSFFLGRKSVSFTDVPEIDLRVISPPAFASVGFCLGCKFEPWQRVFMGKSFPNEPWHIHDITIISNPEGMGGDIGGSCRDTMTQTAKERIRNR